MSHIRLRRDTIGCIWLGVADFFGSRPALTGRDERIEEEPVHRPLG